MPNAPLSRHAGYVPSNRLLLYARPIVLNPLPDHCGLLAGVREP